MTYIIHSYVVCRLSALTDDIRVCPTEIEDARWVPFAQFQQEASHPVRRPYFFPTYLVLDGAQPNPLDPTRPFIYPILQILKTVAQLTAGLDLSQDVSQDEESGAAAGAGDIVETEHPSILPNRPSYKLYHTALPKPASSS